MAIIQVEHLSFAYATDLEPVKVLDDINLEIDKGEAFALMGPTGAGKSTLCLALNGIVPHLVNGTMDGRVLVDGIDTRDTYPAALSQTIGIIHQDPDSQLFCPSVEEEVAFGLENAGLARQEITERIDWALRVVHMDAYRKSSPARLSGGQKQRVAIACSLALLPKVLVLDEPTSSLDPAGQAEVYEAVERLRRERQVTLVLVGTDAEHSAAYTAHMAFLVAGKIVALGEPQKLLADKQLVTLAGVYPPQMMELAWELNSRCQTSYNWLHIGQAESVLRARLQDPRFHG